MNDKKFRVLIATVALLICATVGFFAVKDYFYPPINDDYSFSEDGHKANQDDVETAQQVVQQFVSKVGNFGWQIDSLKANRLDAQVTIIKNNPNGDKKLFISRAQAYLNGRDLVYKDSPIFYAGTVNTLWTENKEVTANVGFHVKDIKIEQSQASVLFIDEKQIPTIELGLKFLSEVKVFSGNRIMTTDVDMKATATLVKIDNKWLIYDFVPSNNTSYIASTKYFTTLTLPSNLKEIGKLTTD